ncbi:MAG TPA: protein kinase [Polyangiaceae bacterium]
MRVIGGRFRLEQKIASGGMGDVYRATNVETGERVAVKILEPSAHPDDDAVERFRTEARVSALLTHPSIVRVFDLVEEKDGALALVMELLVGRTLKERLAQSAVIDPEVAVAIAVPILNALDHAHAAGVVHRDVKPGNVFLATEPDGRVTPKLLDFGVAKSDASTVRTMDGHILGTSRYVSPEQARGQKLDGRSDLFSVGTLLYEAITGESPFAGEDAASALRNVLEQVVDAHERIPPRLWLVVQKALAKQPYARHPSANAMATALANAVGRDESSLASLLRDEPPPLPRVDTSLVAVRDAAHARTSRRVWPIAIALAAIAAIALGLVLTRVAAPKKSVASPKSLEAAIPPSVLTGTTRDAAPQPSAARTTKPSAHPKPVATTPGF